MEGTTLKRPTVQLSGADGNAYAIIGLCKRAAKEAGWPPDKITAIVSDMMAGDYDHLLAVAMGNFDIE